MPTISAPYTHADKTGGFTAFLDKCGCFTALSDESGELLSPGKVELSAIPNAGVIAISVVTFKNSVFRWGFCIGEEIEAIFLISYGK